VDRRGFVVSLRNRLHDRRVAELQPSEYVSISVVARRYGISRGAVRRRIQLGMVPGTQGEGPGGELRWLAPLEHPGWTEKIVWKKATGPRLKQCKPTTTQFGAMVRRFRFARGLTQVQLADMAGVAKDHLSEIETGGRVPVELSWVAQLAEALELGDKARLMLFDTAAREEPNVYPDRQRLQRRGAK
jgi:DNA-binding XRE family transcriptional regulator